MTKKTELTNTENKLPVDLSTINWDADVTDMSDVLIPQLKLMQPGSGLVVDGKAAFGDIINSVTNEVVCKSGGTIDLIPIMIYKEWAHWEVTTDPKTGKDVSTFLYKEPWAPSNANYPKTEEKDGKRYAHVAVINCFMCSADNLEELPYLVSFQKTSYTAGRALSTHFQMGQAKKYIPWSQVFCLSTIKQKRDTQNWCIFDVTSLKQCTTEQYKVAEKWRATLTQSKVQVDEADEVKNTSSRLSQQAAAVESEIPL